MHTLKSWQARVFIATWLAYAGVYFTRKAFSVAKLGMLEDPTLGFSPVLASNIDIAFSVAYSAGQLLWGVTADRFGPRRIVIAGMLASTACAVAMGLSTTVVLLGLFFFALFIRNPRRWAVWAGVISGTVTAVVIAFSGPLTYLLFDRFGIQPDVFGTEFINRITPAVEKFVEVAKKVIDWVRTFIKETPHSALAALGVHHIVDEGVAVVLLGGAAGVVPERPVGFVRAVRVAGAWAHALNCRSMKGGWL